MRDKLTRKPSMVAFALLVAASVGLAGCGDHVGNKQAAVTQTKLAIRASEAGKQLRLSVPKTVRAGLVTVELTNTGKAFHEAQLIRLEPGHTPEDALKVIAAEGAPSPGWIHVAGGTGPAPPGGKRSATQRLRPGNYIVYDAPFQNEGKGLRFGLASFTVEGQADDSGELPNAVAKIEAYEYGFKVSRLTVGKNTIEFSNTGTEPHHVIAVPYKPGATLAEVRKAFMRKQGGAPPLDFENPSYTARIPGGTKQTTELYLDKPGKYALLCFVSDRKGGPPHVAMGMIAEVIVH
jgi:plastocyanin